MATTPVVRMGSLDHAHIRVPNLSDAVAWYSAHLGFEPVEHYDFWANGVEGGPVQISADGGRTSLALFEGSDPRAMIAQVNGVAFSVDADTFIAFSRSLPNGIDHPDGGPLTREALTDFDLCFVYDLVDPWGNTYELNCYDHAGVRAALVDADGITPDRKWPPELYSSYLETR
jgi:catechol 2,3-dioxygenase-like lactoylglutathione lyase family enzyme